MRLSKTPSLTTIRVRKKKRRQEGDKGLVIWCISATKYSWPVLFVQYSSAFFDRCIEDVDRS